MQVGGSGGRSPPGKQGGFGGAAGPPNGGPSLQRGGMRGRGSEEFLRGSSHGDDVIPEEFLEEFLGGGKEYSAWDEGHPLG